MGIPPPGLFSREGLWRWFMEYRPLVGGGQGKSGKEVEETGFWFGVVLILVFLLLAVALVAYQKSVEQERPAQLHHYLEQSI
jgi:hypothetical protein